MGDVALLVKGILITIMSIINGRYIYKSFRQYKEFLQGQELQRQRLQSIIVLRKNSKVQRDELEYMKNLDQKRRQVCRIQFLHVLYIVIMIMFYTLMVIARIVPVLYFMITFSIFGQILQLNLISGNLRSVNDPPELQKKRKRMQYLNYSIWFIVFLAGLNPFPGYGSRCTNDASIFPVSFYILIGLMLVQSFTLIYQIKGETMVHVKDDNLLSFYKSQMLTVVEEKQPNDLQKSTELDSDKDQKLLATNEPQEVPFDFEGMLNEQRKKLICTTIAVCVLQTLIIVMQVVFLRLYKDEKVKLMKCSENGMMWTGFTKKTPINEFILVPFCASVNLTVGQFIHVFYRIPMKYRYFEAINFHKLKEFQKAKIAQDEIFDENDTQE